MLLLNKVELILTANVSLLFYNIMLYFINSKILIAICNHSCQVNVAHNVVEWKKAFKLYLNAELECHSTSNKQYTLQSKAKQNFCH